MARSPFCALAATLAALLGGCAPAPMPAAAGSGGSAAVAATSAPPASPGSSTGSSAIATRPSPGAAVASPTPPRTAAVPRPARKPPAPSKEAAATRAAATPASETALPSAALPSAGPPDSLIGLDPQAATALLGPPAETVEHPPATVWRYRAGACSLELVFFLDSHSGQLRSLRDDLRGAGSDPEKRKACLRAIAEAAHAAPPAAR